LPAPGPAAWLPLLVPAGSLHANTLAASESGES
jgi:hypothetical protein